MSFLTAEWRRLAMANYEIDPAILQPDIPAGTELDLWKGKCYVSLVGFMFLKTRLAGMPIPWHRNFEEVNLRFYVRRKEEGKWKRGVVFVKELVPRPAISFVANTIYREHYETVEMKHEWRREEDLFTAYLWKKKRWHRFKLWSDLNAAKIAKGSLEEFITEHYWGYARSGDHKTIEYEVTHPRWEHYPVKQYEIDVDFKMNYGARFQFLNNQIPDSVLLAEGSPITVERRNKLII